MLLLAFLLPLAVYLVVLAHINRRPRAVLVSGPWDFAGLLFAASGFLLLGGPALLSSLSLNETWRRFWLFAKDEPGITQDDLLLTVRIVLFALYFVLVVGGAAFLLWRRRRMTAIYNVDPAVVETVLGQVLERWQLPFVQTGNVLTFEPEASAVPAPAPGAPVPARPEGTPALTAAPPGNLIERTTTLAVDVAPAMCHVTLTWDPADSLLRREVEGQLGRALADTPAPPSAVGEWMLLVAYSLFFLILLGLTVLTLFWLFQH
ncbi:MAG: hypothetical protein HYS12_22835 [Planctomycetes bacterium]|nr:hypothetical protein [Planctomycetota bacterium]